MFTYEYGLMAHWDWGYGFVRLSSVDLSNNQIAGSISNYLFPNSLVNLNVMNNQLSGSIPNHVGDYVTMLTLTNNTQLRGPLPSFLRVEKGNVNVFESKNLICKKVCPRSWVGRTEIRARQQYMPGIS